MGRFDHGSIYFKFGLATAIILLVIAAIIGHILDALLPTLLVLAVSYLFQREITRRKRIEAELRVGERRYRDLIEYSHGLICTHDLAGTLLSVNSAAALALGFRPDELIGRNLCDLLTPEVRRFFAAYLERIKSNGKDDGTLVIMTHDGKERIWLYRNILYEEPGKPPYVIGHALDVTELRRAEDELRRSEESFRSLSAFSPIGIFQTDSEGQTIYVNDRWKELSGLTLEQTVNDGWLQAVHPEDRDALLTQWREARRRGHEFSAEFRFLGPLGETRWVYARVKPILSGAGNVLGYVGADEDITERKVLELELQQARDAALESTKLKSVFLANTSHEIRTPLNAIFGTTGLLLDSNLTSEQRELCQIARSSADALLAVINDVLDFSRIEAGKLPFAVMDFDLFLIIESAIDLFTEQAQVKGLNLFSLINGDVPTQLRGDPGRFRQILINLLSNAIKFTDKGEVTLRVTKQSEANGDVVLRFTVSDTGIGIPRDGQDRVFNAFSQVESSPSRGYGGTGLGLAISRQLVKLMHGRIGVKSELGRGSTFWFTVPFEKRPQAHGVDPRFQLEGLRVLLIGDSTAALKVLEQQLTSWAVHTHRVETTSEAEAILRRSLDADTPYDLGIIDERSPLTDEPPTTVALRSNGTRLLPLIMMTPLGFRRDAAKLRDAGIEVCLTKPVKQSALLNSLVRLSAHRAMATDGYDAKSLSQAPQRNVRVLVVEDNATNRRVVLHQLQKLGYSADAVANGLEALAALNDVPYDIVLMDCLMPEMDGYEATKQIRLGQGKGKDVRIIAMTAGAFESDRQQCFSAGMNDYLAKPIREEELTAALVRWSRVSPESNETAAAPEEFRDGERVSEAIQKLWTVGDPNLFQDFIAAVIDDVTTGLKDLEEGLARGDSKRLSTTAHTLKSVCGTIGAKEMMELCEHIEARARVGSVDGVHHRLKLLKEQFPYLRDVLKNEIEAVAEVST